MSRHPDTRRRVTVSRRVRLLLLVVLATALTAAVAAAAGAPHTGVKPVIGKPVAVPAQPVAGKRFAVSFKVTRSDTGAPLVRGTMICDPSVAGRVLPHAESFRAGAARLAFTVPASAAGKSLKVKVTIRAGGQSATRVSSFRVGGSSLPSVSIGDVTAAEGSAGTTTFAFPVTLSAAATKPVSVTYATADGTATAPADFAAASGTLTFQPGEKVKTIAVSVVADTSIEQTETFTVAISGPVNAVLEDANGLGTITNDDTAVPVTPGAYKGATQEGNYVFFTVLPSRILTGFRVNDLTLRCGGLRLTGPADWSDESFAIKANGSFAGNRSWNGSQVVDDVEYTKWFFRLTGQFGNATSASGTVYESLELNYQGKHWTCTSYNRTWSAALQP